MSTAPESFGYGLKRLLLGKPLITEELGEQRLPNPVALGVLSPDAISSSAYGTEEILLELMPYAGLAAFTLLLPITGVILLILVLVTASYRQVVVTYTRAGGSYVVARENFGPRVAQIAAAALLIDYVVTVAVQAAAGTVAVVSAISVLGPYSLEITVGVVVVMCYVNLRGLREAGRPFAMPTYSFIVMLALMIVVGVVRRVWWSLPMYDPAQLHGAVHVHSGGGLVMGATILVLLRAFANGGSSLTGVEAISNTVGSFRAPEGHNARRVLTVMATILGLLIAGVSYLAFATRATPYTAGYPSVLSQIARAAFGSSLLGHVLYVLVQLSTAAILFTGANTSFNGFPALANFVAVDQFLPRQLTKRGHRLVFSNGIIVLAVLAVALLVVTGGSVNSLIPFYAIGVFTGFAMAGYGMSKFHLTHKEPGWRRKLAINLSAGIAATIVVGIFAVAKFTEGAWLVVVVFPLLVLLLMRLNREYRSEAAILEEFRRDRSQAPDYARHDVLVLVDTVDLAVLEALRYGRGLDADTLTAVHLMIDAVHADRLRDRWDKYHLETPLRVIDCPDRRIPHATYNLVTDTLARQQNSHVSVLLPRRSYAQPAGRLLHGRTAETVSRGVSRIHHAAAIIVPYDVQSRIRQTYPERPAQRLTRVFEQIQARITTPDRTSMDRYENPDSPPATVTVDTLTVGRPATVEGRVHEIDIENDNGILVEIGDATGTLHLLLRTGHLGIDISPGQLLRVTGTPHDAGTTPLYMIDPLYHILERPPLS